MQKRCELQDVFKHLRFGEVLSLISKKHLSPWLLLCSSAFKAWAKDLDKADQELMMMQMGWHYWRDALDKQPAVVKDMQAIVQGLGL